jgi:hypothetical protein
MRSGLFSGQARVRVDGGSELRHDPLQLRLARLVQPIHGSAAGFRQPAQGNEGGPNQAELGDGAGGGAASDAGVGLELHDDACHPRLTRWGGNSA